MALCRLSFHRLGLFEILILLTLHGPYAYKLLYLLAAFWLRASANYRIYHDAGKITSTALSRLDVKTKAQELDYWWFLEACQFESQYCQVVEALSSTHNPQLCLKSLWTKASAKQVHVNDI